VHEEGGLMRNPLTLLASTPVPYVGRGERGGFNWGMGRYASRRHLAAMGGNGTLFSIVNRTSTATASVDWHMHRARPRATVKCAKCGQVGVEQVLVHPALTVLNKPNDHFTRQELVESTQQHVDLTGEGWTVMSRIGNVPYELWCVRPDRMEPITSPTEYLLGYVYTGPDGEQVPLDRRDVLFQRMPNPEDPYRGMGPVQAIMPTLDGVRLGSEWNRNFFANNAIPGGAVKIPNKMPDREWRKFQERWQEMHQGISNAGRVAVLEGGAEWVDLKFTQRDMQFVEMARLDESTIRGAFGMPKFAVGDVEDVNRATAEASKAWFAEALTVPRLDRWKGLLNNDFLPQFPGYDPALSLVYTSPVPADKEADRADLTAKAAAYAELVSAGVHPDDAAQAVGLPPMRQVEIKPAPAAANAANQRPTSRVTAGLRAAIAVRTPHTVQNVDTDDIPPPPEGVPAEDADAVEAVDLDPVEEAFAAALLALLLLWMSSVVADWIDSLVDAVTDVITRGSLDELATLTVATSDGATKLLDAMVDLAEASAGHVVDEAATQDVTVSPVTPKRADLKPRADTTAALEGQRYTAAAGQEAARMAGGELTPAEIGEYVRTHLDEMSDARARAALGGALTGAQNTARAETLQAAPVGSIYASEVNDGGTCGPCSEIHGRWLATTDDMAIVWKLYPGSGYINCRGGSRCRGTVVGIWRTPTSASNAAFNDLLRGALV
jgi:HK97 family phage portal protein